MKAFLLSLFIMSFSVSAFAQEMSTEFDPFDPQALEQLKEFDEAYEKQTGKSSLLEDAINQILPSCYQRTCPVFIDIDKATQRAQLFVNGALEAQWKVSTGVAGRETPNFDRHPNGRIYDVYSSSKYPGGDYNGLGNMPYAVFISGGFAIHGTPQGNWSKLGSKASHGCIRLHPDHGFRFNRLVRKYGVKGTWITVN